MSECLSNFFDGLPFETPPLMATYLSSTSRVASTFSPTLLLPVRSLSGATTTAVPLLVVFVLTILLVRSSLSSARKSGLREIPGPWYAPFTSLHLRYMFARGTIWRYVENNHHKYGDVVRLGPRQIWVSGPAAMKEILSTVDLPKVTMYAEISRDRNSPGLFGEIRPGPHRTLKKFLGPAFTVTSVDKLDGFFKTRTECLLEEYYRQLEKTPTASSGPSIRTDFMRDLHCLALDIMGQSAFGKGFGQIDKVFNPSQVLSKRDKAWSKIPNAIFDGLADRYRFVFIKRFLRRMGIEFEFDWPSSMTKAISELIQERKSETNDIERIDLLQHMLDNGNRPDTGERMSDQDIIDQMSELLLAGSETTSGTISCLFLELARNPRVKQKLLHSLPVLGAHDKILDSKTVRSEKAYEYLEACIKENLRMHPIASEMGRRTIDRPVVINGMEIPPYTVVSASYRRLHLDEHYWPEPNTFWPERWLQGDAAESAPKPHPAAYYPFSSGKHSCIGQNFAYAEMRTVAANILTRFDVHDIQRKEIDFRQFITMQMHDGSWDVILTPRAKSS